MAKKKEQLPELKSKFSKADQEYITKCSKMIKWPVDINTMEISVPHTAIDEAKENLTVEHLINKFGFYIQSAIEVPENRVFDPELRSVKAKRVDESVIMPKKSEVWLNSGKGERLYIKTFEKGQYTVTFLGSMLGDKKVSEDDIKRMVVGGQLVMETS